MFVYQLFVMAGRPLARAFSRVNAGPNRAPRGRPCPGKPRPCPRKAPSILGRRKSVVPGASTCVPGVRRLDFEAGASSSDYAGGTRSLPREAVPLPRGLRPLSGRSWYRPRTEQRKRRTLRGRVRLDHRWWRHGESNSGPRQLPDRHLQAQSLVWIRTRCAQRHARGVLTGSVLAHAIPITCAGAFPLDDVAPGQGTSRG